MTDYSADAYEDDFDDAEEWKPGECDHCGGSTPEELASAAQGRSVMPVCACAIGQGAAPNDCRCGAS